MTRLAPEGREVARVPTGAPQTNNCAFGGPGLNDLYITSAGGGPPRAGGLFVARGVGQGVAPGVWRG